MRRPLCQCTPHTPCSHYLLPFTQALAADAEAASGGPSVRVMVAGLSTTCSQKIHKWVVCAAVRVFETAGVTAYGEAGAAVRN